jgi:hypothetical protein
MANTLTESICNITSVNKIRCPQKKLFLSTFIGTDLYRVHTDNVLRGTDRATEFQLYDREDLS